MIAASGISNQEAQGSTRFPAAWLMLRTLTSQHEEHTRFPGIGCDSASFGAQSKKMNTSPNSPSAKAATANLAETARGAVEVHAQHRARRYEARSRSSIAGGRGRDRDGGFGFEAGHHVRFRDYQDDAR
jgi:hypothetical protein